MKIMTKVTPEVVMFAASLVLFEFSVYICNDMIQPAMPTIVREMGVSSGWITASMTAFMFSAALFQWLFGPLSDRYGRRPVMLSGIIGFAVACVAILSAHNIYTFIFWRFVQGIGLCFISSVGYAVVQESFSEKLVIKMMAIMGNAALIAPLVGPLLGAMVIQYSTWHITFVLIAMLALISWIGLYKKMPETIQKQSPPDSFWNGLKGYREIFSNPRFLKGALVIPTISMPLLIWIALSPEVLMEGFKMTPFAYAMYQIPVFASMAVGNVILACTVERISLDKLIKWSFYPAILGAMVMLLGGLIPHHAAKTLVIGMSCTSLASGMSASILMRFTLTESNVAKGAVSAAIGMISMFFYAIGIEVFSLFYQHFGVFSIAILASALMATFVFGASGVAKRGMEKRASEPKVASA